MDVVFRVVCERLRLVIFRTKYGDYMCEAQAARSAIHARLFVAELLTSEIDP